MDKGKGSSDFEKMSSSIVVKKSGSKQSVSGGKPRKARLVISSFNPWSVFRVSFLLSVALGIIYVVAAVVIWFVLNMFGSQLDSQLFGLFSFTQIISFTVVIAVINVVLINVIMMILALVYNISASIVGGVKVVLKDD